MKTKWIIACALMFFAFSAMAQVAKPVPPIPAPSGRAQTAQVATPAPSTPISAGRALMGKVVNALGGKKAVLSVMTERTKEKRVTKTPYGTVHVDAELTVVFPDRVYIKTKSLRANDPEKQVATSIVVLNSGTGFISSNGAVQDLPPEALVDLQRALKFDILPTAQHASDPNFKFAIVGSEKIGGVNTATLKVTADGYSTRWNVDPISGRVVRISIPTMGSDGASVPTTFEYSDWRIVDGITLPSKIIETGATSSVIEIQSLEINPTVQSALFERPGASPIQSPQGELPVVVVQELQAAPQAEPPVAAAQDSLAAPQAEPPVAAAQDSQTAPKEERPVAAAQDSQTPPKEERPVAPVQAPQFDFRKTRWGMTRAQVMAAERGKPIRDKDVQHLHVVDYEDIVAGLRCRLIYIFVYDQLVRAKYSVEERHVNKNLYLDDFDKLSTALASKYGKPTMENTLWSDELYKKDSSQWGIAVAGGHMSKYTSYDLPATKITASLTGDNFEVSVEVGYVSKALESLEDSAKADEDKDKL